MDWGQSLFNCGPEYLSLYSIFSCGKSCHSLSKKGVGTKNWTRQCCPTSCQALLFWSIISIISHILILSFLKSNLSYFIFSAQCQRQPWRPRPTRGQRSPGQEVGRSPVRQPGQLGGQQQVLDGLVVAASVRQATRVQPDRATQSRSGRFRDGRLAEVHRHWIEEDHQLAGDHHRQYFSGPETRKFVVEKMGSGMWQSVLWRGTKIFE